MEGLGEQTLSEKLEAMCPCYDFMDKLFGLKANVQHRYEIDSRKFTGDDFVDHTSIGNAFEDSVSITSDKNLISDWDESQMKNFHNQKLDDNIDETCEPGGIFYIPKEATINLKQILNYA
ncbi:hypothetical protein O181_024023 [Austropuccinia psidii MF-1]|uniref:Uncharacterized protein n=1 Tax=Austropuccinia psidii MF-1 TaxID=1389203 RepID=A0A9Q3CI54_9BASI|nr:hypothetical protein [Austropuccinia psidii MF-1]